MRISFHMTAEFAEELREFAARRCECAFDRFLDTVTSVQISLRDENGPRGGTDIHCLIRVSLNGLPDVIVHELGESAVSAITTAVDRASYQAARRIHRRVDRHRHVSVDNFSPAVPAGL